MKNNGCAAAGFLLAVLSGVLLTPPGAAAAATNYYYVAPGGSATAPYDTWGRAATDIQTAVDRAAADLVPGTTECVVLVTNGTWTLTSQILITNGITLRGFGGREGTILDAGYPASTNRGIEIVGNAAAATVDGFTIVNGYAYGAGAARYGGGIYAHDGIVNIWNCAILSNRASLATGDIGYGGGLAVVGATMSVTNCVVANNTTLAGGGYGGGIYAYALNNFGHIADCTVSDNNVGSVSSYGGGIYAGSLVPANLIVSNCTIAGNAARGGGGLYMLTLTATDCTIVSNKAAGDGGGGVIISGNDIIAGCKLFNSLIADNSTTAVGGVGGVSINRGSAYGCTILRNRGGLGGGVGLSHAYLESCLIAGNYATTKGGGVSRTSLNQVDSKVVNCTIVRNRADGGGGGVSDASTGWARTNGFLNTIVCNNASNTTPDDIFFTTSALNTLFGYSCSPALTAGVNSNMTADPLFAAGGSGYGTNAVLGDYTLQVASPAINRGTNIVSAFGLDLARNPRLRPWNGRMDLGCYEMAGGGPLTCQFIGSPVVGASPMPVTFRGFADGSNTVGASYQWIFGDGDTQGWSTNADVTHTYAARTNAYTVILNVTNAGGETATRTLSDYIMVYPPIVYVSTNGLHVPPFETWGNAATNIQAAIDLAAAGISTVLVGDGTYLVSSPVIIGKAVTVTSQNGPAGTVVASRWPLTTNRCFTITGAGAVLDGFTVTNGCARDSEGGGILMSAAGTVRNCIIVGNRAEGSSASAGGGVSFSLGTVAGCTIRNNTAANYNGGGAVFSGASCLLSNCLVTANAAALAGGGVYHQSGMLTGCIISNNTAGTTGGGVHKYSSYFATLQNCLIAGNSAGTSAGGLHVTAGGGALVQNCTIADNAAATWAGGLELFAGTVRNSILDGNLSPFQGQENVVLSGGAFATNLTVPLAAGAGNVTGDPVFADRAAGDYRIRGGSPAIDSADASAPPSDLAGLGRPRDGDNNGVAAPDMGAYEADGASGSLSCSFAASALEAFDAATVAFTAHAAGADTNGLVYAWAFGDGNLSGASAAYRTISHAYGVGSFPVVLAVSNAAGQTATWGTTVRVIPSALYVAPNGAHQWPYTNWSMAATNIQAAVDAAGSIASTGSWIWVADGVYTVRQPVVILDHVTLKGVNGAAGAVVNGNYPATSNRCLTVNASGATVDGLTLTAGFAAAITGDDSMGGGAYVKAGVMKNCNIRFNQAYNGGGGVYLELGTLRDSIAYGNLGAKALLSPAGPGGVYFNGLPGMESVVSNCWIACNTNNNTGGGIGGLNGIISNCRVERNVNLLVNTGTGGGGVRINSSLMENCEVVSNYSASVGGGVQLYQYAVMRGCLVVANQSVGLGGGVNEPSNTSAKQKIENCTIVGNSGSNGGGVYSVVAAAAATNCIVVGNQATLAGGVNDVGGTATNFAYSCSPSLVAGVGSNITADPMFVSAGSGYGTNHVTGNYRLKPGSPCADTGAVLPWMTGGATDLEGNPRILNAGPNMGAYEKIVMRSGSLLLIR